MAYINKKTFDIIQDSSIRGGLRDYFEVDDVIALPIQILNRKGYCTEYCCGGHPFAEICVARCEGNNDLKSIKNYICGTYKVRKYKNGWYRVFYKDFIGRFIYILFADGVILPSVPEGFTLKGGHLEIDFYEESDTVTFFEKQLVAIKTLTKWALSLPDRSV